MTKIIYTENQLTKIANQFINKVPSKIVCFYGQMGSGKTTLIKAIVKQLGVVGEASSPTFGIVNEYQDINEEVLAYHFDFYRLNDENEALDLGIEDYFFSDAWIFMEWPEKIENLLPTDRVDVHIEIIDPTTRELTFDH
ncbi:MAG: tRNA (adenosine(37)-N6)-threonylcarbamoyltransferase complex ATPase subunit type 1 TsaE [Maribacter sp.]|nr:tRNA (adenosine(37)-N6)-threonylcarbamoyltransferase complex ATPase subunit type 1 TsaE [Maribacter sp.]